MRVTNTSDRTGKKLTVNFTKCVMVWNWSQWSIWSDHTILSKYCPIIMDPLWSNYRILSNYPPFCSRSGRSPRPKHGVSRRKPMWIYLEAWGAAGHACGHENGQKAVALQLPHLLQIRVHRHRRWPLAIFLWGKKPTGSRFWLEKLRICPMLLWMRSFRMMKTALATWTKDAEHGWMSRTILEAYQVAKMPSDWHLKSEGNSNWRVFF